MFRLILLALLCGASPLLASVTAVTATVTDTDGQTWMNGTWTATVVMPGGPFSGTSATVGGRAVPTPVTGSMDGSGILAAQLTATDSMDQAGVKWSIAVCPNASITPYGTTGCTTAVVPVTGASLDLTGLFNAVTAPRFPAGIGAFGYSDAEVFTPSVSGLFYFNTSKSISGVRMWDGHHWVAGSGAGTICTGTLAMSYVPAGVDMTSCILRQLTQDDILPGFSITGFYGGNVVEIGANVTNPSFSASYSSTPTSASITNSDGINSPFALASPFTSATIAGTFRHTTQSSATFVLTAVSGTTRTASVQYQWAPRVFGGVGSAGATGCAASGANCTLVSASGTLYTAGLYDQSSYGPYSPSAQKVYILTTGCSHSFKDATTGFAYPFNAPTVITFSNQFGAAVTTCLYESTNTDTRTGLTLQEAN